jgi:hypothetical protein
MKVLAHQFAAFVRRAKAVTPFHVLLCLALACAAAPAAHAQTLLFDYVGFDYEYPVVTPGVFGAVGNGYVGLGEVPVLEAPLVSDQTNYQYTYVLSGTQSVSRLVSGSFVVISYAGPCSLTVYEDSRSTGTAFDYGIDPPNGTAPSSFIDGTPILVGEITDFLYIVNTATGSGSYDAHFEAIGGTQLGNLPVGQRTGWTFSGVTTNTNSIPEGYAHQVDGQTFLNKPTPARSASWGEIKRRYR